VYVCKSKTGIFAHVYSSEAAAWIEEISANKYTLPSVPGGNALYFVCSATVLKYDLAAREMSLIRRPHGCTCVLYSEQQREVDWDSPT
jgi:hypothetical protein